MHVDGVHDFEWSPTNTVTHFGSYSDADKHAKEAGAAVTWCLCSPHMELITSINILRKGKSECKNAKVDICLLFV